MTYLAEAAHHLLYERAHGSDVDYLELISVDRSVFVDVFSDLSQHRQQRHVRLSCTLKKTTTNKKLLE